MIRHLQLQQQNTLNLICERRESERGVHVGGPVGKQTDIF